MYCKFQIIKQTNSISYVLCTLLFGATLQTIINVSRTNMSVSTKRCINWLKDLCKTFGRGAQLHNQRSKLVILSPQIEVEIFPIHFPYSD